MSTGTTTIAFPVSSSTGSYIVVVGAGSAAAALRAADCVIADRYIAPLIEDDTAGRPVIEVEATEDMKTLEACAAVIADMHRAGVRRDSTVVAVGGGVIQDVATFVTSTFMRGIAWRYVPTTLMSMADSCIGGKSSINVAGIKNLVGNIYPPESISVDPRFLPSLPRTAMLAGLAEAVKICFVKGRAEFDRYLELAAPVPTTEDAWADLISHTLEAKKWFVEIDEFDRSERQLLNFGHSFGHAFEAAVGFAVPHGLAVALGIVAACRHPAASRGPMTVTLDEYCAGLLRDVRSYYRGIDYNPDKFQVALSSDKKGTAQEIRLVLPSQQGSVEIVGLPRSKVTLVVAERAVREALEEVWS